VLALGNPTVPTLVALPGTELEIGHIKEVFPDAAVFLGALATKERLVSDASRARYLHVAAHGQADVVDPLHSTLRLASTTKTSGVFEAYEAYSLSLPTTEIVTLSACETGLGKVSRGDEVWGFTRAFLGAGARGVLVSLWPVADASTEILMGRFYERLKVSDAALALQDAQLLLIKDPRFAHPFFWAPFDFVGAYTRPRT
jgi:CHAT domain-containing protein